mgnify:CR=1 FL=1
MSKPEKSSIQVLLFTGIILVISSLLLSAASEGLKSRKQANVKLDKQRNILKAFNVALGGKPTAAGITKAYTTIESVVVDSTGTAIEGADITKLDLAKKLQNQYKLLLSEEKGTVLSEEETAGIQLPVYQLRGDDGTIAAYAIPIVGDGLWGRIFGYVSLDSDLNTLRGITFYSHKETPGLGAEITEPWFQQNFVGKAVRDIEGTFQSVKVMKPGMADEDSLHEVDGISGATITSDGVTDMLKLYLQAYGSYFEKIRKGDR